MVVSAGLASLVRRFSFLTNRPVAPMSYSPAAKSCTAAQPHPAAISTVNAHARPLPRLKPCARLTTCEAVHPSSVRSAQNKANAAAGTASDESVCILGRAIEGAGATGSAAATTGAAAVVVLVGSSPLEPSIRMRRPPSTARSGATGDGAIPRLEPSKSPKPRPRDGFDTGCSGLILGEQILQVGLREVAREALFTQHV